MKIQEYLICDNMVKEEQLLLFQLRSRSFPVKMNFQYKYKNDLGCRACNIENIIECELHFCESCVAFQEERNGHEMAYDDIFGPLEVQVKFIKKFKTIARKWRLILDTSI